MLMTGAAAAQERSGNFFGNIFNRGEQATPQQAPAPDTTQATVPTGPVDSNDVGMRIDRIEHALRELTGTIEQLQYQNQQLQMQLKRMQDDTEYRFQQLGSKGPPPAADAAPRAMAPQQPAQPMNAPAQAADAGRRSDAFDPALHPNAPGQARVLGTQTVMAPAAGGAVTAPPVGAPGGREAGAPLDLSTLAGNPPDQPQSAPAGGPGAAPQASAIPAPQTGQLPPVMAQPQRNSAAPGVQLATLPPSSSPKDEYDLAYGYVLRKDYALAAQAFGDFMTKYPNDKMLPNAQYWLGESQYQQQRYREAAESFLAVSTKYERAGKAPEALLRLGQSLAALHQKEAACATLAEVGRKYPKASPAVKRDVAQEQKRGHC